MSNTSGISDLPESPLNRLLGLHEREVSDLLQKYGVHTPSNPPLRPNTNTSKGYVYLLVYNPCDGAFYLNYSAPPLEKAVASSLVGNAADIKSHVIKFFKQEKHASTIAKAAEHVLKLFEKNHFLPMYLLTGEEDRHSFRKFLRKLEEKKFDEVEPEAIYRILPLQYETTLEHLNLDAARTTKPFEPEQIDIAERIQKIPRNGEPYSQLHLASEILHYSPWIYRDSVTHGLGMYKQFSSSFSAGIEYLQGLKAYSFRRYRFPIIRFNSMLGLLVVGWYTSKQKQLEEDQQSQLRNSLAVTAAKIGESLQWVRVLMASSKLKAISNSSNKPQQEIAESILLLTGCTEVMCDNDAHEKIRLEDIKIHKQNTIECHGGNCPTTVTLEINHLDRKYSFTYHPRHINAGKESEESKKAYSENIQLLIDIAAGKNDYAKVATNNSTKFRVFLDRYSESFFPDKNDFFAYFLALICFKCIEKESSLDSCVLKLTVGGSGKTMPLDSIQRVLNNICEDGITLNLRRSDWSHDGKVKTIRAKSYVATLDSKKKPKWWKALDDIRLHPLDIIELFKRNDLEIAYSWDQRGHSQSSIELVIGDKKEATKNKRSVDLNVLFPQ